MPAMEKDPVTQVVSGRIVLGTVWHDIHDIGKNFVASLLSVHGVEVVDIGVDVPNKRFVGKAEEVGADIIGLSSLLSTCSYYQRDVIQYLTDTGVREKYYVIVGGGPITGEWAKEIGADGYGRTARDAVQLCRQLIEQEETPPLENPIIFE
jgi:methanogenic corrinoid protein MtbC1